MGMKHRAKTSKIKYEHAMIKGLRKLLEGIEDWEEIKSIFPGKICHTKSVQKFHMKVQYKTKTGLKCLVLSRAAVQEVFIVTSKPDKIRKKIESLLGR